jgi:hypothetical protein
VNVAERARRIATFRYVEVRLMEIAAAWTPTTPELEAKVLLGRHIWDFAQHADALGKRVFELRLPLQHSLRPAEPYCRLLEDLAGLDGTAQRLGGLYAGLLPGVQRRYSLYAAGADPILDAPSLVILERIQQDLARQRQEAEALRAELRLPAAAAAAATWAEREAALELMAA